MSILVIAEHDNNSLRSATLNTVTAASQMGEEIHLLVSGYNCAAAVGQASNVVGVSKVLHADHAAYESQLAENLALLIAEIGQNYSHVVAPATTTGKNVLPRVAALLDVGQVSDIIKVDSEDTFKRPFYAGGAIATVQSLDPIKVITVRGTAFDPAEFQDASVSIESIDSVHDAGISVFVGEEVTESERPELTAAKVVVSGGRALGSKENFALLEKLADKLGGAVGASRAAVDAGYVANDLQVGQTGKIVAPDLYVAIGISGAIQHLAGMKESKVIVAINTDEEAPIFSVADYGLVADLFDAVPELESKL